MYSNLNILFLGGAKRVSLAEHLIAAGQKMGKQVGIFSYELSPQVPIASVGSVIVGRRWKDADLYDHLLQIIAQHHIQMVLPFVDPAIEVAAKLKELADDVFIPVSPADTCRIMFDKRQANEWFIAHGVPVPPYYKSVDEAEAAFPLILKPRNGSASKGIIVLRSNNSPELPNHTDNYLIQTYLEEAEEFTVDCYVDRQGRTLAIVPRIRLEVAGGEAVSTRTVRDEAIINLSATILATGAFRGPVTIQYIRNRRTGHTYVMEINPRLGGAVIAAIAAGADIPTLLLSEACGQLPQPIAHWKAGTFMTRYFKEVIFYADNH
ncbi:ATP-grasp domain-containing protein [Bacteroides sp. OttesenSCG-928-D19]|nr:ATP-grasp domain-containing protein [Bacteroides sp. OttesenSCG-928-D19]